MNKRIPINLPSITELEIANVTDAITNGWGEKCFEYINRFESNFATYLGSSHALSTSSCTGAIHLALLAMGVSEGDEVIIPEITWIASAEPVIYLGAKPVFVDVLEESWCIDPQKFEQAITPRTKAVIVVHVYGNLVEMDPIIEIANKHGIMVIEDAAEALGSEYKGKKAGSIGDVGVFSFHGTKTCSTGEGGMLVTNHQTIYDRAVILNNHGRSPKEKKTYWMSEYGYKYKMSNLQAAMGCAQLERISELISKKRLNFSWYKNHFADKNLFRMNPEPDDTYNSYWLPTVVFDKSLNFDREMLFQYLKTKHIDSRPFFYPLSILPMFEEQKDNRVAYDLYSRSINLPSFHDLTELQANTVSSEILEFVLKNNTTA